MLQQHTYSLLNCTDSSRRNFATIMRQAILSLLATLTGSATAGLWGNCSNSSSGNSNWLVFDPKCAGKGSFCVGSKLVSTSSSEAQCQTACEGNSSCTAFANDYRGGSTGCCHLCGGDCTSPCKCSYYGTASPRVTTEYLDTQVIMSMITDSGDEYEYQQVLNTFEYRFGLSMSIARQG